MPATAAPRVIWTESDSARRWRKVYPKGRYSAINQNRAHQPYIWAVAATLKASGFTVTGLHAEWCDLHNESRDGFVDLKIADNDGNPEGHCPMYLRWSEVIGWTATIGDYESGLGDLPLVPDPIAVTLAVASVVNYGQNEDTPVVHRDTDAPDIDFEEALATYRTHPGYLAVKAALAANTGAPVRLDVTRVPAADLPL